VTYITRFAPSPTGPLHLGHAFSAITAARRAEAYAGAFLRRIEDIDRSRSKAEWEAGIYEDLRWLGLRWPVPVMRQSERFPSYRDALGRLVEMGVCYPCRCTRRDIRAAVSAPQEGAPNDGPAGSVYPGTCRARPMSDAGTCDAIRLDVTAAFELVRRDHPNPLEFTEAGPARAGTHRVTKEAIMARIGDIVLARKDIGTSYHLAVVVDDADQGITEVIRGEDLFEATSVHVLLQNLLSLPRPTYFHHSLIRDGMGRRLAKRDDARSLARYRADGLTPCDVYGMVTSGSIGEF